MSGQESKYRELSDLIEDGKIEEALNLAAEHFRARRQFDELFEMEKCRIRHQFGLPIQPAVDSQQVPSEIQGQLEDRMLDLCREIGTLHCRNGDISRGWLYLQALMDREFVDELFRQIKPTDENTQELIDIGLGQWAAPLTGYRLLIDTRGTCNAITFFDSQIAFHEPGLRSQLASILVQHLYDELRTNVLTWVVEHAGPVPGDSDAELEYLVVSHPQMFADCGHHLDVSHLASVVRIARYCTQTASLEKARQLAAYGCRLDQQLKYPGELPFEELFEAHLFYFEARLKQNLEQSIDYFRAVYERSGDPRAGGVLVELYRSSGKTDSAIETAIRIGDDVEQVASVELIDLARADDDYERIKSHFRENDDLASYCLAEIVHRSKQQKPSH